MIDFTRLKDIREDNDLKQKDMANILNVKRSAYSLWELGINIIPLKYLVAFADYFNYSIDYVLGLTKIKGNDYVVKGLNLKILGKNLKEIRIKKGISQNAIAKILNVNQACIAKYEKGDICISTSNLYKYSKTFKVSMAYLCGKRKQIPNKIKTTN